MGGRAPAGDNVHDPGESWRKSSYSMSNGQCVEAARLAGGRRIGVRDSAVTGGAVLRFEPEAWIIFVTKLRTSPSAKS